MYRFSILYRAHIASKEMHCAQCALNIHLPFLISSLLPCLLSSLPPSLFVLPPPPPFSLPPPPPRSLSSLPFLPSLSPCPLSPLLFSLSSLFLFKARTVVKAALELLVVFVNYSEQSDSLGTNMSAKGMDSPRMNSPEGQSTPLVFKNAVNIVSENKGISMGNMFCV